jgi:HAD superfamily hydrolase (TIGR01509 family)
MEEGLPREVPKPWGSELCFAHTDRYAGKILRVRAGCRLSVQYHQEKDETSFVLSGRVIVSQGQSPDALTARELGPGDSWRTSPLVVHTLEALEDAEIVEVSTPQLEDVIRLEDRYGRVGDITLGNPPGLVIFDCDGVLVDSEPVSNRVLAEAITDAGLVMSADEVAEVFEGMQLGDIAARVASRLGRKLPDGWVGAFENKRAIEFRKGLQAVQGVADALTKIRAAGIPVCVASQATRAKIELTLRLSGLTEHFESKALFSSRMVPRGKPHPDLFLLAARSMGADVSRCVVVEDGVLGTTAARLAGMRALGYSPDGNGERLADEGATTFGSMAELPALLGIPGANGMFGAMSHALGGRASPC